MAFEKTLGFTINADASHAQKEIKLLEKILKTVSYSSEDLARKVSTSIGKSAAQNISNLRKLQKTTSDGFGSMEKRLKSLEDIFTRVGAAIVKSNKRSTDSIGKNNKAVMAETEKLLKTIEARWAKVSTQVSKGSRSMSSVFGQSMRSMVRDGALGMGKLNSGARNFIESGMQIKHALFGVQNMLLGIAGGTFVAGAIKEAMDFEAAMVGLRSVARAYKQDMEEATKAAKDLASDGLISISGAALTLKQLIPDFGVKKAKELAVALKDIGAFNRQGTLTLERALVGATQGIKNRLSILVDNIGLTKNLSQIMKEQGFRMEDLDDATKGANAKLALYKGLMKEAAFATGDAERLVSTMSGAVSKLSVQFSYLLVDIGNAIIKYTPLKQILLATSLALSDNRDRVDEFVKGIVNFVTENKEAITSVAGITAKIAAFGLAVSFLGTLALPVLSLAQAFRGLLEGTVIFSKVFVTSILNSIVVLATFKKRALDLILVMYARFPKAMEIAGRSFGYIANGVKAASVPLLKFVAIFTSIWYAANLLKVVLGTLFDRLETSEAYKSISNFFSNLKKDTSEVFKSFGMAWTKYIEQPIKDFSTKFSDNWFLGGIAKKLSAFADTWGPTFRALGDGTLDFFRQTAESAEGAWDVITGVLSSAGKQISETHTKVISEMRDQYNSVSNMVTDIFSKDSGDNIPEKKIDEISKKIGTLQKMVETFKSLPIASNLFSEEEFQQINTFAKSLEDRFAGLASMWDKYMTKAKQTTSSIGNIVKPEKLVNKFNDAFKKMYDGIKDTIKDTLVDSMVEGTSIDTSKITSAIKKFYAQQIADEIERMIATILFPDKAMSEQERNTEATKKQMGATIDNTKAIMENSQFLYGLPEAISAALSPTGTLLDQLAGLPGQDTVAGIYANLAGNRAKGDALTPKNRTTTSEFENALTNLRASDIKTMLQGVGQFVTIGTRIDMLSQHIQNQSGIMGALSTYQQTSSLAASFGAGAGQASTLGIAGAIVGFGLNKLNESRERKRIRNETIAWTNELNNQIAKSLLEFSDKFASTLSNAVAVFRDEITGTFSSLKSNSQDAAEQLIKAFEVYQQGLNYPVYNWVWARDKATITSQGLQQSTEGMENLMKVRFEELNYFKDFADSLEEMAREFKSFKESFLLSSTKDPLQRVNIRSTSATAALTEMITARDFEQFQLIPKAAQAVVDVFNEVVSAVEGFGDGIVAAQSRIEELNILNKSFSIGISDSIDSIRKIGFSNEQMLTENAQVINSLFDELLAGASAPSSMASQLVRRFDETDIDFARRQTETVFQEAQNIASRLTSLISEQANLAFNTFGEGAQSMGFKNAAAEALTRLDTIMSGLIQEQIMQQESIRQQEMSNLQQALGAILPADTIAGITTMEQARFELEKATTKSLGQLESLMADLGASLVTNNDMLAEVIWNAAGSLENLIDILNQSVDESLSRINNHMLVIAEMLNRTRPFDPAVISSMMTGTNIMSASQIGGAGIDNNLLQQMLQAPVERMAAGPATGVVAPGNVIINISGNLSKEEILNEVVPVIQQAINRSAGISLA